MKTNKITINEKKVNVLTNDVFTITLNNTDHLINIEYLLNKDNYISYYDIFVKKIYNMMLTDESAEHSKSDKLCNVRDYLLFTDNMVYVLYFNLIFDSNYNIIIDSVIIKYTIQRN